MRVLAAVLVCAALAAAQDKDRYNGPRPPQPDVLYLVHADNLVQTEVAEAREQPQGRDETAYVVSGATSKARTPLAEPIFIVHTEKLAPERLELYKMEVKSGNRQVVISKNRKRSAKPLRLSATRLDEHLYRVEVNEGLGLENGEYSITPEGSNQVFCFTVY